jgi:hypothetical protein
MKNQPRKLIFDFTAGNISRDEFLRAYPVNVEQDSKHIQQLLSDALSCKQAEDVECALLLGFEFGFSADCVDVLCRLLDADWHQKHEDIVRVLQQLRSPSSVDALCRATSMRHQYLEYNDSTALAIKCVWALSKIGTQAALDKLKFIVDNDEREEVKATARSRLAQ